MCGGKKQTKNGFHPRSFEIVTWPDASQQIISRTRVVSYETDEKSHCNLDSKPFCRNSKIVQSFEANMSTNMTEETSLFQVWFLLETKRGFTETERLI